MTNESIWLESTPHAVPERIVGDGDLSVSEERSIIGSFFDGFDTEERLENMRHDIYAFGVYYFDVRLTRFQVAIHHAFRKYLQAVVNAPVGHGKTHVESFIDPIHQTSYDRTIPTILISKNDELVKSNATRIAWHLENNEKLIEDYGAFVDTPWGIEKGFRVQGANPNIKEPTFLPKTKGASIEGGRYPCARLDDPIDIKALISEADRKLDKVWFDSTLQARMNPGARIIIVGSRWHEDDLFAHIMKKPGYKVITFKAIYDEDQEIILSPDMEMAGGARITYEWLNQKRLDIGEAMFQLRYQNNVQALEGGIFKREWLRYADKIPDGVETTCYQGWDFNVSLDKRSDYTAGVTGLHDASTGTIYIADIYREHIGEGHPQVVIAEADRHQPFGGVGAEALGFQHVIFENIRNELKFPAYPVTYGGKTSKMSKEMRLTTNLQYRFQNGKIVLLRSCSNLEAFVQEYLAFPYGKHDDTLDGLNILCSVIDSNDSFHLIGSLDDMF